MDYLIEDQVLDLPPRSVRVFQDLNMVLTKDASLTAELLNRIVRGDSL